MTSMKEYILDLEGRLRFHVDAPSKIVFNPEALHRRILITTEVNYIERKIKKIPTYSDLEVRKKKRDHIFSLIEDLKNSELTTLNEEDVLKCKLENAYSSSL
jgi:hypothetical protein